RGMLSLARKQGIDEGRKQGIDEGRKQELVRSICDICELLSIPLQPERLSNLDSLDVKSLSALRERIKATKTW
ncbi:MAG TPA: hypothetical protein PK156_46150, partial [Polyangium sp.]|nr:hypothetical protein [Polyangium sp.]